MWIYAAIILVFTLGCVFFYFVGKAKGVLCATLFYHEKKALVHHEKIVGFKHWDQELRKLYLDVFEFGK